jgi:CubicO group peptidase (beta-lactamase class C family)
MRRSLVATACVAGLALSVLAPAHAQSVQSVRDRAVDANGPAVRRLTELIAAVESGSSVRIRAFARAAYAPEVWQRTSEDRVVQFYTALHERSRGLEVDSLRTTPTEAAALLRSKLTGLWEQLSVRVEPEPPHRILDFSASFSIKPPKHRLADSRATDTERVRELERVARRLSEADAFSGVVLVAKGDSILYLGAFGDADKKRGVPIRPDTRFALASITKTFVTIAVAKLVEQGKLSWDDPLGKFFPDFPVTQARERIRIKHLLTHTAGLREGFPERPDSMDDYVRAVARAQGDSLPYEPGTRSVYSNANFVLLGKVIELASGRAFYEYIREHVFRPAGMEHADFDELRRVPAGQRAIAYEKQYTDAGVRVVSAWTPPEPGVEYPAPFAGVHSTAHDLFRFASSLRSGRFLRPQTVALLFTPKPEAGNWGYGFDILDEERGLVGHGGSWSGMSNSLDLFTRSGYTAVILSNYTYARSPLREAIWAILP